jgi:septum site-determining protein MinC
MSKSTSKNPIEIKISTVVAISVILHVADRTALDCALKEMTGGVPDFFEGDLAVIDVGAVAPGGTNIDWASLIDLLKTYRLNPVAVRNATPAMEAKIIACGLSIDSGTKARDEVRPAAPPSPVAAPAIVNGAMMIDTPVRAGQRIYARG